MKTKQLALEYINRIIDVYELTMTGETKRVVSVLEADLAAKVEPVGWLKDHKLESGITHTFTENKEHVEQWAKAGVILQPVYTLPQQAVPAGFVLVQQEKNDANR